MVGTIEINIEKNEVSLGEQENGCSRYGRVQLSLCYMPNLANMQISPQHLPAFYRLMTINTYLSYVEC